MLEALHEGHREDDILHIDGIGKERSDLFITEPCYTAADSGYKEGKAGVFLGETDEIVHIGFDGEPIILCPQLVLLPFRNWAVGAFGALGLIISISLLPSFVLLHRKQIDKVPQCRQAEGGWQCPFPTGALEADNYAIHSEHERNECYRCKNDS